MNQISREGMFFFSQAKWRTLNSLYLCTDHPYSAQNLIGDQGCKYLSRASLKNIQLIALGTRLLIIESNSISSAGVIHLAKTQWKQL
jgi:hypothetical protein